MERKDVEVGPIWNNDDASNKARSWVQNNPGWRYTGEWRTTIPGQMSTVTVERVPQATMNDVMHQQPAMIMTPAPMMMPQPMMMM